jgi:hypothetical protein
MHCHPERSAAESKDLQFVGSSGQFEERGRKMGQFDTETDAALKQLSYEELSGVPGGEFAEIVGDLLMLLGTGGLSAVAGGLSNLVLKVRKLAGASYASNLIYAITAVRNDLVTLYKGHEELRERIDSLPNEPKFAEAVSALALRAMHTSVKDRLKRLARIVVNGVKENDLEPESLDDMMRAAVELTDWDVFVLGKMYESQKHLLSNRNWSSDWSVEVGNVWTNWNRTFGLNEDQHLKLRSALSRLQSVGLVAEAQTNFVKDGSLARQAFGLLPEGKKFYERLQEIAA